MAKPSTHTAAADAVSPPWHHLLHKIAWDGVAAILQPLPTETIIKTQHVCRHWRFGAATILRKRTAEIEQTNIVDAYAAGNFYTVRAILERELLEESDIEHVPRYHDVNAVNSQGRTVLIAAAAKGDCDHIQLLITHGADIEARDPYGYSALHWAVDEAHPDAVRALLNHNADPDAIEHRRRTPLHLATRAWGYGDVTGNFKPQLLPCAAQLLSSGAQHTLLDDRGDAAIGEAARSEDTQMLRILLDHGVSVETPNRFASRPLHVAAHAGNRQSARLLLENHARINSLTDRNYTPIHMAVLQGWLGMTQLLVWHNADLDIANDDGRTPLMSAAAEGGPGVTRELLDAGADATLRDDAHRTAMDWATHSWTPAIRRTVRDTITALLNHHTISLEDRRTGRNYLGHFLPAYRPNDLSCEEENCDNPHCYFHTYGQ